LPYFGCGTSRSISIRRVLFILAEAAAQISVVRRDRLGLGGEGVVDSLMDTWLSGRRWHGVSPSGWVA